MNRLNVNPTRMELSKLKKKLETSVRGHKLLKDKQDELMRQFIALIHQTNALRQEVEAEYLRVARRVLLAKAAFPNEAVDATFVARQRGVNVGVSMRNQMGLSVPVMEFEPGAGLSSGLLFAGNDLTAGAEEMAALLPKLLELAEKEKNCALLADEIEKVRRRVNALEYMTIPQLRETIRYIRMKLEDSERDSRTRLIKIKEMEKTKARL